MPFFNDFGIKEDNLIGYYHNWKKENSESIEDYLWFIFNHLLNENAKQSDNLLDLYKRNERIYREMTLFRRKVEGKKANEILQLQFDNYLKIEKETFPEGFICQVEIISGHCCEYCDSLNGKRFDIDNTIENRYLASVNYTREKGCNCCYSVLPKRDERGSLIRIDEK